MLSNLLKITQLISSQDSDSRMSDSLNLVNSKPSYSVDTVEG